MALKLNLCGGVARPSASPSYGLLSMTTKRSPKRLKYATPRFAKEGGLLYVEVDPSGADSWKLDPVIELLRQGAVGVIPTDTVYAIVCDLKNNSAIERLRRIKDIEPSKRLSILCHSFKDIDTYTLGFPRGDGQGHASIFRVVKQCLPGPYTFILTASKQLPKECIRYGTPSAKYAARKNVGVRLPDDAICQAVLEKFGAPLISTSVKRPKEDEWMLDPVQIADTYGPEGLDFVVDGGVRVADPSTVVDMTGQTPKLIRQGKGPKLPWMEDAEASTRFQKAAEASSSSVSPVSPVSPPRSFPEGSRSFKQQCCNGATSHFTYNSALLHDLHEIKGKCRVTLPNGVKIDIRRKGKCWLKGDILLHDVLLVPELADHLFRTILEIGKPVEGLYQLEAGRWNGLEHKACSLEVKNQKSEVELWHNRLGHVPFDVLDTLLKNKSPRTQFGKTVKVLRSDNGGEFFNATMTKFLQEKGCVHQSSCPHTPQQNGVVERKHRHLLEVARALMFESGLPKKFWGDSVLTGTHIINRLPSSVIQGKSSWEKLFSEIPHIEHLRVFGCSCFVSTIPSLRDKFDPRALECIFLGYPTGQKGYKVFCLATEKIIVSRHVIFREESFPFKRSAPQSIVSSVPQPYDSLKNAGSVEEVENGAR
ncbi:unnamed protein product [Rhodiola kirilowii]